MTELGELPHRGYESTPDVIDLTDGASDMRTVMAEHTEFEKEQFTKEVLERLLILGLAARDCNPAALILRYDRPLLDGQPLQTRAIEIMEDTAMAGLDRLRGDGTTTTVDHSVYDQLFDRYTDSSHADFVDRLAWAVAIKRNLMRDPNYEVNIRERQLYKSFEARMVQASNKIFQDMFGSVALARNTPEKYQDFLERMVDPVIAMEYLDIKYWQDSLAHLERMDHPKLDRQKSFCTWIIAKGREVRAKHLGKFVAHTGTTR